MMSRLLLTSLPVDGGPSQSAVDGDAAAPVHQVVVASQVNSTCGAAAESPQVIRARIRQAITGIDVYIRRELVRQALAEETALLTTPERNRAAAYARSMDEFSKWVRRNRDPVAADNQADDDDVRDGDWTR